MNRNLVGKVRLAIIKCPRLTYSPYLTDSESVPYGQKVRTGRTKKFLLIPFVFPSLICSFDLRRRYSRSEKLKKIWLFPRLFVSLRHNCK